RRSGVAYLAVLDVCSPAAMVGYAVGRVGCLISGDGDYGIPTHVPWGMSFPNGLVPTTEVCTQYGWPANCAVHPTPIYETIAALLIAWYLWKRGGKALRGPRPVGLVTAEYLLLSGLERFLVEFIRINPRSFLGVFSNAQAASLASM